MLWLLVVLVALHVAYSFHLPRFHFQKQCSSSTKLFIRENWFIRPNEEIIVVNDPDMSESDDESLFDIDEDDPKQIYSIQDLSVKEIYETYGFSMHYLGDFICSIGAKAPIRLKEKLENFLSRDQIKILTKAIYSLEPGETSAAYEDQVTLGEYSTEFEIPILKLLSICKEEKINIPFGPFTKLHKDEMKRLENRLEIDYPAIADQRVEEDTNEKESDHNKNMDPDDIDEDKIR